MTLSLRFSPQRYLEGLPPTDVHFTLVNNGDDYVDDSLVEKTMGAHKTVRTTHVLASCGSCAIRRAMAVLSLLLCLSHLAFVSVPLVDLIAFSHDVRR